MLVNTQLLSCPPPTPLTPLASPRHPLPEDGPAGFAFHRLPGSPQGSRQLHQDRGEGDDSRGDDPEGEREPGEKEFSTPLMKSK